MKVFVHVCDNLLQITLAFYFRLVFYFRLGRDFSIGIIPVGEND